MVDRIRARLNQTSVTLEHAPREWYAAESPLWKGRQHASEVSKSLEDQVFRKLSSMRLDDITPQLLVTIVLRPMERSGKIKKLTALRND
jgi:hypothetical protein